MKDIKFLQALIGGVWFLGNSQKLFSSKKFSMENAIFQSIRFQDEKNWKVKTLVFYEIWEKDSQGTKQKKKYFPATKLFLGIYFPGNQTPP